MRTILSLGLMMSLFVPYVHAGTDIRKYEIPDVRNAYCGAEVAPYYCKCAFHNQQCKSSGLEQDGANAFVLDGFREWNRQKIQTMGEQCLKNDGYWEISAWQCTYCTEGDVLNGKKCVAPEKVDTEALECKAALTDFDNSWEKYSDFDTRIPVSQASFEVKEYNRVLDEIANLIVETYELEIAMEVQRHYRLELRAYKQALVQNIKTNILKAFWRLSYVTYATIKSAKGSGGVGGETSQSKGLS
jgi:hypothetical protein